MLIARAFLPPLDLPLASCRYLDAIFTNGTLVWATSNAHGRIPGTTHIPQKEELLEPELMNAVNKHWTSHSIRLTFRMFTRSRFSEKARQTLSRVPKHTHRMLSRTPVLADHRCLCGLS